MITYITEQILTNIIWNVIVCKILKLNIQRKGVSSFVLSNDTPL